MHHIIEDYKIYVFNYLNTDKLIEKNINENKIIKCIKSSFDDDNFDEMIFYCNKFLFNNDNYKDININNHNFIIKCHVLVFICFYFIKNNIDTMVIYFYYLLFHCFSYDRKTNDSDNVDIINNFLDFLSNIFSNVGEIILTKKELFYFEEIRKVLINRFTPLPEGERLYSKKEDMDFINKVIIIKYDKTFRELAKND